MQYSILARVNHTGRYLNLSETCFILIYTLCGSEGFCFDLTSVIVLQIDLVSPFMEDFAITYL